MRTGHVVVLGLMGAGKTTFGRALSERLGLTYRDSDTDIEARTGRSGREIALNDGVDALHEVEAAVLLDALAAEEPSVIGAAGWIVEDPRCVAAIGKRGFAVWLDAPSDVLYARMQTGIHRREVSLEDVERLRTRRAPIFSLLADLHLDANDDPHGLVETVAATLGTVEGSRRTVGGKSRNPMRHHETGAQPNVPPTVLVIFAASGDLTSRKLMPALAELIDRGFLGPKFAVVGVARSDISEADFRSLMEAVVDSPSPAWHEATSLFRYVRGGYADPDTYQRLTEVLAELEGSIGAACNCVYYFASPPSTFPQLATALGEAGLNRPTTEGTSVRVVIEKPYGTDLQSARELDARVRASFEESQIYRIDHYLGKETVQNLLALRFANAIFEPLWNRQYVDHIEVTIAESIGVGSRGSFYEEAGALRDMVQNHVMQVLTLVLMEAPATTDADGIRDEKVKVLKSIVSMDDNRVEDNVIRAQYCAGLAEGQPALNYRHEDGVNSESLTETYVAMRLSVDNWRWAGVPIYVRTGKRLPKRLTEVVMHFRRAPHLAFAEKMAKGLEPNALVVRIQPESSISLRFGAKVPGQAFMVRTAQMDFDYRQFAENNLDGYERLLLDALLGDQTLFIRSDEVIEAWRIVSPLLRAFAQPEFPLATYAAGTWGPTESDALLQTEGRKWRKP